MENKNTGYPHIDKPWMKFYPKYKQKEYPKINLTEYRHVGSRLYHTEGRVRRHRLTELYDNRAAELSQYEQCGHLSSAEKH